MTNITPFPGTIAARNALCDPKTSPEARTAAKDLLWAASCTEYRRLTDAELSEVFPVLDRFPRLAPPEDHRGPQMLATLAGVVVATAIVAAGTWGGWW